MKKVSLNKIAELDIYANLKIHEKEIKAIENELIAMRLYGYLLHLKEELSIFYRNCESDLNNPNLEK